MLKPAAVHIFNKDWLVISRAFADLFGLHFDEDKSLRRIKKVLLLFYTDLQPVSRPLKSESLQFLRPRDGMICPWEEMCLGLRFMLGNRFTKAG